jgi:hypothetical protein
MINFNFLCPVWGSRYINEFLDWVAPTLLAPGNLPALSGTDSVFTILTHSASREVFESHPTFLQLSKLCRVQFVFIDETMSYNRLEDEGNSVFLLNLAYQRGMAAETRDHNTVHFVIMNGDVLFADGCCTHLRQLCADSDVRLVMEAVFRAEAKGVERDIASYRTEDGAIAIPNRSLVRLGLKHLHPATDHYIWDNPGGSSPIANHFYWRIGSDKGLLAHCYLMHPVVIRPVNQVTAIDGFIDYAGPGLCGDDSSKIRFLDHSDDFVRLEVAPADYEMAHVTPTPYRPETVAKELANWTTAFHRQLASRPIVYLADDDAAALQDATARSAAAITEVDRLLAPYPVHPHAGHAYWGDTTPKFAAYLAEKQIGQPEVVPATPTLYISTTPRSEAATVQATRPSASQAPAGMMEDEWGALLDHLAQCRGDILLVQTAQSSIGPALAALTSPERRIHICNVAPGSMVSALAAIDAVYDGAVIADGVEAEENVDAVTAQLGRLVRHGGMLAANIRFFAGAIAGTDSAPAHYLSDGLPQWFWRIQVDYFGTPLSVAAALLRQTLAMRSGGSWVRRLANGALLLLMNLASPMQPKMPRSKRRSLYLSALVRAERLAS